ncbi:hypothetical protein FACS189450_09690 [Spirochaetia bacterium]|nr:hypothetical protein FACS189450_09690 [Spirochaetia bacterium]
MERYLILIGGGLLQYPAVEVAHSMGLSVCIMDMYGKDAPACAIAETCYKVSTKNVEGCVAAAVEFAGSHNVVGVYSEGGDNEPTVAAIAEKLDLYSIGYEKALCCNNKILMREKLAEHNVPGPKFAYAENYDEAVLKIKDIGFPLVVKAIDSSGSRGVRILFDDSDFKEACEDAQKNSHNDKRILLEEYLDGVEYSVDTIVYNGILYPCGISDREFNYSKKFAVQTGSVTPSRLPEEIQKKMYGLMSDAAKAIGVDNTAFKGDLILCGNEPKVLEITARLSGGFDSQYRKPYSFGINLLKATIDMAIGNPLDFRDIVPQWVKFSKTTSPFPNPGTVISVRGLDEIKAMKGVRNVFGDVKVGDIVPQYTSLVTRIMQVVISADSYEELLLLEEKVLNTLVIETK